MKIRGHGRRHWKTFWKGEENNRHKFSRARAKGGEFLELGDKEVHGKGGFWSILGTTDVYRLQVLAGAY